MLNKILLMLLLATSLYAKPEPWNHIEFDINLNSIASSKFPIDDSEKPKIIKIFKGILSDVWVKKTYTNIGTASHLNIFTHPHIKNRVVFEGGNLSRWAVKKNGKWILPANAFVYPYDKDDQPDELKRAEANKKRDLYFKKYGINNREWRADTSDGKEYTYFDATPYVPKFVTKTVEVIGSEWSYTSNPENIVELLNNKNTLETKAVGEVLYYRSKTITKKSVVEEE